MAEELLEPDGEGAARRRSEIYDRYRRQRIVANERYLRERNSDLREEALEAGVPPRAALQFACECGNGLCDERIALSAREYQAVHSGGERYVTAEDHLIRDLERVVERRPGYDVVEKLPQALVR